MTDKNMLLLKRISFLGNNEFLSEQDYAAQCDEHFTNEIRRFKDGRSTSGRLLPKGCKNAVLEEFEIDGKRLIDLIPFIEDCEPI